MALRPENEFVVDLNDAAKEMKIRKRRDLRPNALTLMRRRRESLRNSRMVFVMAMKTSAKGDSSSFL
jgi:hypothetical protein